MPFTLLHIGSGGVHRMKPSSTQVWRRFLRRLRVRMTKFTWYRLGDGVSMHQRHLVRTPNNRLGLLAGHRGHEAFLAMDFSHALRPMLSPAPRAVPVVDRPIGP